MLVDKDLADITIEFLGLEHMRETIALHREPRKLLGPRNRAPLLNSLARDYFALTGAFVSEMFEPDDGPRYFPLQSARD